ncbi:MAG TPA: plastocyanin/azurin family copper-binding protein [Egibacteraceae bacterium]|nr:plastocyanin/azurin family copper-binding protein [Egibacteraceae bacterium]
MSPRRSALLGLAVLLALTGCSKLPPEVTANEQVPADQRTQEQPQDGGGGQQPPAGEVVRFVAQQLAFSEAPSQVPAGQLAFELDNQSGLPHNVTIEGVNNDEPIVEARGNENNTASTQLEPGSYTYYCSVPGHREAGMEGQLTVAQ